MQRQVHGTNYRKLRLIVVTVANANPMTLCHRCHNPIDKCKPHRNGKPARWTAGHLHDSQPDATLTLDDLAPECSPCNSSAGASYGNRNRTEPRTARLWR